MITTKAINLKIDANNNYGKIIVNVDNCGRHPSGILASVIRFLKQILA
jgi:hypothetical protein